MTATDLAMPVLGGGRVLVVEDGEDAAASLAALLRLHGFDTRTARTGSKAIAAVAAHRPHVMIVDLGLPDANGVEVIRRCRAEAEPPAVVVVSGYGDEEHKAAATAAGAVAYLVKPADPNVLVDWVRRLCKK
jgi:DNA-binding response OmpR family regulator